MTWKPKKGLRSLRRPSRAPKNLPARTEEQWRGAPLESAIAVQLQQEELAPLSLSTEDYLKAGGTEMTFVTQQASKATEGQADIGRELSALDPHMLLDVAIVGCGPAGLALAAELGKQGLKVGLIGRDRPFVNTYGVWPDELECAGFQHCVEETWRDTILYTDSDVPIRTGRTYGKMSQKLLKEELLRRCKEGAVTHLASDAKQIEDTVAEVEEGSTVVTTSGVTVRSRLVVVAAGAASGQFLEYKKDTCGVGTQTAYGVEVELETPYPYDTQAMLFMDYRDIPVPSTEEERQSEGQFQHLPTFLYAMPSSPRRVFFEETCLAARPAMPFSVLKQRLERRLQRLGVKYSRILDEEWSYIPVGGDLPDTSQQTLGFGAAACLVHPATGYSLTRSLTEAPHFAAAIASALKAHGSSAHPKLISQETWAHLWSPERKRQRAFMIFGLELILQLDLDSTRAFFNAFFRLPPRLWRGFLASSLSSADLLLFALTTFFVANNKLRFQLVQHLATHPSGSQLILSYLGQAK